MRYRGMMALAALALAPAPVRANDTTARLSAGGLVITRSDSIRMVSEDLFVSRDEVRVRYVFLNTSGRKIVTRVAFPMPEIGGPGFHDQDVAIPVESDANFLGFSTRVDGRYVETEVDQAAFAGGVDRSAWLRSHGVGLEPHLEATGKALLALPPDLQQEARRLGLVDEDLRPVWSLRSAYHWRQAFPAGRRLIVEHAYRPSVGSTAGTRLGTADGRATAVKYCVGADIMARLNRSAAAHDGEPRYSEKWIDYHLVTGGNWKGPIGDFRLVVDKGWSTALVSFCGTGVRRIGLTRFEMRKRNWRPDRNLSILFLEPY